MNCSGLNPFMALRLGRFVKENNLQDKSSREIFESLSAFIKTQFGYEVDLSNDFSELNSLVGNIMNMSELIETDNHQDTDDEFKIDDDENTDIKGDKPEGTFNEESKAENEKKTLIVKPARVVTVSVNDDIKTPQDILRVFFGDNTTQYNIFKNGFIRDIIKSSIVNFTTGEEGVIKSADDIQSNIDRYYEENIKELTRALNIPYREGSREQLNYLINNTELANSSDYNIRGAYIKVKYFRNLISSMYSEYLPISEKNGKYELLRKHKQKNNYSDSLVNLFDEVPKIVNSVINSINIIDRNGKLIDSKYMNTVTASMTMTNIKEADLLEKNSREDIEESMRESIVKILTDSNTRGKFVNDLDNIVTLYNYFFKLDNDAVPAKYKNPEVTSLLAIKLRDYKGSSIQDNIIHNAFNALVNKSVSQSYVSLEKNIDGLYNRIEIKSRIMDNYMHQLKKSLDGYIFNANYNPDYTAKIGDFEISLGSNGAVMINGGKVNRGRQLFKNAEFPIGEWWKNPEALPMSQRMVYETLKVVKDLTQIDAIGYEGEIFKNLRITDLDEFLASALEVASATSNYSKLQKDLNNLDEIGKVSKLKNENTRKVTSGFKYVPFSKGTLDKKYMPFMSKLADAQMIANGEQFKSMSNDLAGNGQPNSSIINLIGDIHNAIKDAAKGNKSNLIAENQGLIKSVTYRADVMDAEGKVKSHKKFNAGEIAYQAIFHDFAMNLKNGFVEMEPTVYADKFGQAMLRIDMNADIKVNGVNKGSIKSMLANPKAMSQLYFETMQAQYKALHDRLINDYEKIMGVRPKDIVDIQSWLQNLNGESLYDYVKRNNINVDIQDLFHVQGGHLNDLLINKMKEYGVIGDEGAKNFNAKMLREDKKFAYLFDKYSPKITVVDEVGGITPEFNAIVDNFYDAIYGEKNKKKYVEDYLANWIDDGGQLIAYKLKAGNNKIVDKNVGYYDIYNEGYKVELNPIFRAVQDTHRLVINNFNQLINGGAFAHAIKTNPGKEFERFDTDTSVAEHFNSDDAKIRDFAYTAADDSIESAHVSAMFKRMVNMQAKIHTFTQGLITGIPKHAKMMVMKDFKKKVWNAAGVIKNLDTDDGSGYSPGVANVLYQYSLGDFRNDTSSLKLIRHATDADTQVAELDKYAVQVATNQACRQSEASKRPFSELQNAMLSAINFNEVFPAGTTNLNVLDYLYEGDGRELKVADFSEAMRRFNHIAGLGSEIESTERGQLLPNVLKNREIAYSRDGENVYNHLRGVLYLQDQGRYALLYKATDISGKNTNTFESDTVQLANGYFVKTMNGDTLLDWFNAFGGIYSVDAKNKEFNDNSNIALADLINNVVIKKTNDNIKYIQQVSPWETVADNNLDLVNQANYYQPLKHALIYQVNNTTGMKNGAKNINSNWLKGDNRWFVTDTSYFGVQGNFDHKFDDEEEARSTESSQMILAAQINGYKFQNVDRLYKALSKVIQYTAQQEIGASMNGKSAEFLAKKVTELIGEKERMGLAQSWNDKVIREWEAEGLEVNYRNLASKQAFSDPNFFNVIISSLSSAINRGTIRRDMSGIAAILAPGEDLITVVDDVNPDGTTRISMSNNMLANLRAKINQDPQYKDNNARNQAYQDAVQALREGRFPLSEKTPVPRITAYGIYQAHITLEDGRTFLKQFEVTDPDMYYNIQNGNLFAVFSGDIAPTDKIASVEYFKLSRTPRNLMSRHWVFNADNGATYCDLDLSSAYNLLMKRKQLNNAKGDDKVRLQNEVASLEQEQQRQLDEIEKTGILTLPDGTKLTGKIERHAGEIIMPAYMSTKYGLKEGMSLNDVNREYFASRYEKFKNKVDKRAEFAFLSGEGKHVNVVESRDGLKYKSLTILENVNGYFVNKNGAKLYKAADENQEMYIIDGSVFLVSDVRGAYKFFDANNFAEAMAIKHTPATESYMNTYARRSYNHFKASPSEYLNLLFNDYLDKVEASFNQSLKVMGVRIPCQALQSIMAMKVVGFIEEHTNRAYVPIKKNWIDGSDFCIDKY